jgi:hypothetical protein
VKVGHRGHIPAHELKTRGVNAAFTNNTSVEIFVYETHGSLDNALQCADDPNDIWIGRFHLIRTNVIRIGIVMGIQLAMCVC